MLVKQGVTMSDFKEKVAQIIKLVESLKIEKRLEQQIIKLLLESKKMEKNER